MNKIKCLVIIFFIVIMSCSKEDGSCPCIKSVLSAIPISDEGEVDEGYCTGEIENPSPQYHVYERVCDY